MFPLMFINCVIIVMAPLLTLFTFVIAKNAQLVILAIGSSFFWVIAILLSSMFWWAKYQYIIIPFAVLLQEASRIAFWWIYVKTFKEGLFKDDPSRPSDFMTALSIGWGYATTNVMISYVSSLSHFVGPACQTVSVFYVLALLQLAFSAMHICWSLLSFEGLNSRTWWLPVFVVLSHLISSILSYTLNNEMTGSCIVGSLSTIYILGFVVVGVTFWTFHRSNGLVKYIKAE